MFFRMKPEYALRGWEGLAWALVKRPENYTQRLSSELFQALLFCDGETEVTPSLLTDTLAGALKRCETNGWIEVCEAAQPLDEDQYYKYYHNRYVGMIFWSVTGKCNFRCRHCFMDAPEGALGELSTEEALNLIDQMADCGVLRVDLTGGELFVRRDLWELVDRIRAHHMVIGKIYTNGWLLNEEVLDQFDSRGMKPQISVSFDGVGWHDWMRGIQGAEERTLNTLRLCQVRGMETDVEMCIHRGNQERLTETIRVLCEIGVKKLKASNVAMTELWRRNSEGNALSHEEYLEAMLRYIPDYFKEDCPLDLTLCNVISLHTNGSYEIIPEFYDGTEKCLNCYMCSSARMACYITPEGRLLPCMPMTSSSVQNEFPKVQEIGLKQGLSSSDYINFVNRKVGDLFTVNQECGACPYRLKCGGGCRATALIEGEHSLLGCDRIMCLLWKGGYVERIRKTVEAASAKYAGRFVTV